MTFVKYILQNFVEQPTRADVVQSQRLANRRHARWDINNDVRAGRQYRAKQPDQKTITTYNIFTSVNLLCIIELNFITL